MIPIPALYGEEPQCARVHEIGGGGGQPFRWAIVQCQLPPDHPGLHTYTLTWKDPRDARDVPR